MERLVATPSSVINLVGIAIKSGQALCGLMAAAWEIEESYRSLHAEITELTGVLTRLRKSLNFHHVQQLSHDNTEIECSLNLYMADLRKLEDFLGHGRVFRKLALVERISVLVKITCREQKLNELLQRLERRKSAFNLILNTMNM